VPLVDRVRIPAGLLLDDRPDLVDVVLGDRDAVLPEDLDRLPDPLLDVARWRTAARRRAGRPEAAATAATTTSAVTGGSAAVAAVAVAAHVRPALRRLLDRVVRAARAGARLARLADAAVPAVDFVKRLHRVGDRRIGLVALALDVLGGILGRLLVLLDRVGLDHLVGLVRARDLAAFEAVVGLHGLLRLGVGLRDLLLRRLADLGDVLLGGLQHVGQRAERLGRLLQLPVDLGARRAELVQMAGQRVGVRTLRPRLAQL